MTITALFLALVAQAPTVCVPASGEPGVLELICTSATKRERLGWPVGSFGRHIQTIRRVAGGTGWTWKLGQQAAVKRVELPADVKGIEAWQGLATNSNWTLALYPNSEGAVILSDLRSRRTIRRWTHRMLQDVCGHDFRDEPAWTSFRGLTVSEHAIALALPDKRPINEASGDRLAIAYLGGHDTHRLRRLGPGFPIGFSGDNVVSYLDKLEGHRGELRVYAPDGKIKWAAKGNFVNGAFDGKYAYAIRAVSNGKQRSFRLVCFEVGGSKSVGDWEIRGISYLQAVGRLYVLR